MCGRLFVNQEILVALIGLVNLRNHSFRSIFTLKPSAYLQNVFRITCSSKIVVTNRHQIWIALRLVQVRPQISGSVEVVHLIGSDATNDHD
jgi:hypothetical protein